MTRPPVEPEAAVRLYLLWLEDPSNLVDPAEVERAEAAVAKAEDPIDRLHAIADLERVQQVDGEQLIAGFVAHAKAYADEQSIPASAFRAMGVPPDVLVQAGFEAGGPGRARRAAPSPAAGSRAPKVPVERLQAAALQLSRPFTLADVVERAGGGSPATVRKAVEALVESGRLVKVGPQEGYGGRGRAPMVYRGA